MTYVVVRVGQLKEHDSIEKATAEAVRLTRQTSGDSFYVAELIHKTQLHVEFKSAKSTYDQSRAGMRWTPEETQDVLMMWLSGKETVDDIAKEMQRSPFAIQCRLAMYGYDPYTTERYKG